MNSPGRNWWKEGVAYQVWPASYKDSNGDGIGDIPGVINSLDYLRDLGVDFVWLSPMYASPLDDMGYDISNYEDVNPQFGTLADMDALIKGTHERGMRLLLDLVVNHTSCEHEWFKRSAESKDNEYRDFYIWRDGKTVNGKRQPPNNWSSVFGGSAWEYVESRDQYYLRLFLKSMPDLNWELPKVRQAIYQSAIRFWLNRGVDGFRVDTLNLYSKNQAFPDAEILDPTAEFQMPPWQHVIDGPNMHIWLQEQRREALDPYGDVVMVGELGWSPEDHLYRYINPITREVDMVFDMAVVNPDGDMGKAEGGKGHSMLTMREGLLKPQCAISDHGCWSTVFLENHDNGRSLSRWGSKKAEYQWQSGKLLALTLSTLSGTLFLYQGQEIGMTNIPRDWPVEELKDNWWASYIKEQMGKHPGDEAVKQKVIEAFYRGGRDHARTPVQWSAEKPYAGFSTVKPWMRVNENFLKGVNIADQAKDPNSLLNYWKKCIAFRKSHADSLIYGFCEILDKENPKVFSFFKHYGASEDRRKTFVVLNYSDEEQSLPVPNGLSLSSLKTLVFGTEISQHAEKLMPWEGRVYQIG